MTRTLAVALVSALIGVSCNGSTGDARVDTAIEESFGEIIDVASVTDVELLVLVRTNQGTLQLHVGPDTYLTVAGALIEKKTLRDHVGSEAIVLHRERGAGWREAWFIGIEPWPDRRSASRGLVPRAGRISSESRRRSSG